MTLEQAIITKKELAQRVFFKKEKLRYKILVLDIVYDDTLENYDVKMTNSEVNGDGVTMYSHCAFFYYENNKNEIILE